MSYLIETDRIIDWLNGRADAQELLSALAPLGLAISLISYGEGYEGIYYGQDRAARARVFRNFLRNVSVLPWKPEILEHFARKRAYLRRQGPASPIWIS